MNTKQIPSPTIRSHPPPGWKVWSYAPSLWKVNGPDRVLTWMEDTYEEGVASCWRVIDAMRGTAPSSTDDRIEPPRYVQALEDVLTEAAKVERMGSMLHNPGDMLDELVRRVQQALDVGTRLNEKPPVDDAFDQMYEAASIVCHRISQFGMGSKEAYDAHHQWCKAWIRWRDAQEQDEDHE